MSPVTLAIEVVLAVMLAVCLYYFWRLDTKLTALRTGQDGALRAAAKLGLPIRFIGVGEQAEDFGEFDARAFASALVSGNSVAAS
jgi:hypothetical protein